MSGSCQKGMIFGVFVITGVMRLNRWNQQVPDGCQAPSWDHIGSWEPLYSLCHNQSITKHRHVGHCKRVQITFYSQCRTLSNMLFIDTWLKQRFSFIASDLRLVSVRLDKHTLD